MHYLRLGNNSRHGRSIFEKNERGSLVAGAVDAVGKIAGRFGDADRDSFHKIRLSDSMMLARSVVSDFHPCAGLSNANRSRTS